MSKPTIKDLQDEVYELRAKHAKLLSANDSNIKEIKRLKGRPKVQEQLNMANGTVAELMKQVETLKGELTDIDTLKELYANADMYAKNYAAENHALKAEIERPNRHINLAENQLHREQHPLVVNHYHNCVINK